MEWYLQVLKNYTKFAGRAGRKEYWMFILVNFIIAAVLFTIDYTVFGIRILSPLYSLAVLLPGLAVLVRRLHDTHRSGWWALVLFIPVVGFIVMLVFLLQKGDEGDNKYGGIPEGGGKPSLE